MATKIGVLLTVFNRKEKTLHCLRRLSAAAPPGVSVEVTLLDDGSTDGTSEAVAGEFPDVHILRGDGSAFWNGGMRRAWQAASSSDPDFYLWLNDDTLLDSSAIEKLLKTSSFFADQAIIVGTTYDAETGKATYGGVRRNSHLQPLRFSLVQPQEMPQPAHTMNGNCVLVPQAVFQKVGNLSPDFTHGMGDFDYGLRAQRRGVEVWVAPGLVGTCSRNPIEGTWQDETLPRNVRLQKLRSIKGLPPRDWASFTSMHGGPLWPVYWSTPYVRTALQKHRPTKAEAHKKRVVILYKTLPQYRRQFFELVRQQLAEQGVQLDLVYGQPTPQDAKKKDTVEIPWAIKRPNTFINIKGRTLYWQPVLKDISGADLVIVEQASKLLVNYMLILRYWLGGEKLALWGHGKNFQEHDASKIGERIKRLVSTRVWWWFAYNETSANVVRDIGFPASRITLVQNAIDTTGLSKALKKLTPQQLATIRQELNITSDNVAIYAGGMYPDKRMDFLIQACRLIKLQIPDFHIIFIGSGIEAYRVKEAAQKFDWIHELGVKFDLDKVPYFALSKVFLMPGLVGLAVLDSFALETPMVTTNLDYHSPEIEYLQDGINGLIVKDSQSAQAYATAVIHLLQNQSQLNHLVEGCRIARKNYTVENMAANFVEGIIKAME